MAVAAHLEETAKPTGTLRDPRRQLRLELPGATESGAAANVLVHNISATGLLFENRTSLTIGERIEIDLPHAGATGANVIWTSDKLFGCQFDTPISSATLSAAQLRGAVGQDVAITEIRREPPAESLGLRLQRLRKDRGLTLAQLAAQLGVSKPTVWAWEQGKARPADSRIDSLAQALGLTRSELQLGHSSSGLHELLARSRERIARAVGIDAEHIKILIEL